VRVHGEAARASAGRPKRNRNTRLTLRLHATRAAARYLKSYTSVRSPRA
jgi:hypothetical protein